MTKNRTRRRADANALNLATGLGFAGMHSAITLWYRLPMLAAGFTASGTPRHAPELERMVSEKTSAMVEGAFNVQREMVRLAGAAMTGRLDVSQMQDAAVAIASAGLRPAMRTVKANSRRLSRR
jgi:hypothetical protein